MSSAPTINAIRRTWGSRFVRSSFRSSSCTPHASGVRRVDRCGCLLPVVWSRWVQPATVREMDVRPGGRARFGHGFRRRHPCSRIASTTSRSFQSRDLRAGSRVRRPDNDPARFRVTILVPREQADGKTGVDRCGASPHPTVHQRNATIGFGALSSLGLQTISKLASPSSESSELPPADEILAAGTGQPV